jgi:zinc transport system permease protein
MELLQALHYGFLQRALLASAFIAILCATLGIFLVLKRFSLIGDGLAHVAFGAIALGLLLRMYPLYVSIPVVMLSSVWILKLSEKGRLFGDTAIGIVSASGISIGVLLASCAGGFNVDLFSYLFGNILAISRLEVAISIVLSLGVLALIKVFYYDLLSVTFDEEYAHVSGIKVKRINTMLILLTALTVVLAIRIVGTMLVSSLLIFPAAVALQLSLSFAATILCASLVAVGTVLAGIVFSFIFDLPTGAAIVLLNLLLLIAAMGYRKFTS